MSIVKYTSIVEYTKEDLEEILERDFLLNPAAFISGRTNDNVVDSMVICFALDREWLELFAKWVENYEVVKDGVMYIDHRINKIQENPYYGSSFIPFKEYEINRILEHYERVKHWLEDKEAGGYERGVLYPIMDYCINY